MHRAHRLAVLTMLTSALILGGAVPPSFASDAASLEKRAGDALAGSRWSEAAGLYQELSQAKPADPAVWFNLGFATLNADGSPSDAITALQKALELGFRQAPALVNIARAQAMASNSSAALKTLEQLADIGPSLGVVQRLASIDAFDSIRSHKRFVTAVKRLTPCSSDEYRQFDFWLGEWEVQGLQGQVLGKNTITESLGGCMLIENWDSASGFKGLSINYFDNGDSTWNQTFRDNTGNVGNWPDLKGTFRGGSMVLENLDDPANQSRWTWTKVSRDKVRQTAERSTDGGKTWTTGWDSYYIRIKE